MNKARKAAIGKVIKQIESILSVMEETAGWIYLIGEEEREVLEHLPKGAMASLEGDDMLAAMDDLPGEDGGDS